jgi:hypothetical protein
VGNEKISAGDRENGLSANPVQQKKILFFGKIGFLTEFLCRVGKVFFLPTLQKSLT